MGNNGAMQVSLAWCTSCGEERGGAPCIVGRGEGGEREGRGGGGLHSHAGCSLHGVLSVGGGGGGGGGASLPAVAHYWPFHC